METNICAVEEQVTKAGRVMEGSVVSCSVYKVAI
jgi:hypothetical protein